MEMACTAAGEQIPPEGAMAILPETVPIPSQNATPGLTLEGRNLETKVAAVREVRKHIPAKKERLEPLKVDMTKNFQLQPTSAQPPLQCLECHIIFRDRKTQERHVKKNHPAEYAQCMLGDDVLFTCYICDRHFTCSTELKAHQWTHTEKRPNKCPICGEFFRSFSEFTIHKKAHLDEQGYICVYCGKTYKTMVLLKYHRCKVTGERPYSGKACGKWFSESKSLQKHSLTHKQEDMDGDRGGTVLLSSTEDAAHIKQLDGSPQCKPETTFSCSTELMAHQWARTEKQPYKCPICGEAFGRLCELTNHNKVHFGLHGYICADCGKTCQSMALLKDHRREHMGERPQEDMDGDGGGTVLLSSTEDAAHIKQLGGSSQCQERMQELISTLSQEQEKEKAVLKMTAVKRPPASSLQPRTAKRLVVVLHRDKRCDDEARMLHLESHLARRTTELAAEKHRVAPLLAEKEMLLAEKDAEISSLKTDPAAMTVENVNLGQENQRLGETSHLESQRGRLDTLHKMRAGFGELQVALCEQGTHWNVSATPVRPIPGCTSTPPPESSSSEVQMSTLALSLTHNDSIQFPRQHADVSLRDVAPEDYATILQKSFGQVGRFGCLLFRKIISEENYKAWCKTTNWDGSRGKQVLPQNVKDFVVASLMRIFPRLEREDLKDCIGRINEFLRVPRKSYQGPPSPI